MDEDDDINIKPVTGCKKPGRKCTVKKKTVKKVVSKKETTAPEPDKSKVITTKEVKILLSKTNDRKKKTETENKDKIKLANCKLKMLKMVKRALKNQSLNMSKKLDEVHPRALLTEIWTEELCKK